MNNESDDIFDKLCLYGIRVRYDAVRYLISFYIDWYFHGIALIKLQEEMK